MNKTLEKIAKETLKLETLETRKNDSLDFHELSIWQIKEALEKAYKLGQDSIKKVVKTNCILNNKRK